MNGIRAASVSPGRLRFYAALMKLRPAQLVDLVKLVARIRRETVKTPDQHIFWVDPISVFGQHLLQHGVHEPDMVELLFRLLRPGDTFVDIGGNEGYFSILAASAMPDGRVYCIEPQSRLQPVVTENIRLNSAVRIQVRQVALAERSGSLRLFLRPSVNTGASSLVRHWMLGWAAETVSATTLDALWSDEELGPVRLVKMDCEGAEARIIAGAAGVLERQLIDFIVVDFHPKISGVEACVDAHTRLLDAGYGVAPMVSNCVYVRSGLADGF